MHNYRIKVTAFSMQKLGNEPDENEDSFSYNVKRGKFAIADGVSDSCFSKLWSETLTNFFVNSDYSLFSIDVSPDDLKNKILLPILKHSQEEWNKRIDWKNLPWYVERKARMGAFATFLGVEIKKEKSWRWRAIAIGDTCLFQVSKGTITDIFPRYKSSDFGNEPFVLSSVFPFETLKNCKVEFKEGKIDEGEIILATDAVAKWIIEQCEKGMHIWRKILSMKEDEMKIFFKDLIQNRYIRNDDITLVLVRLRKERPDKELKMKIARHWRAKKNKFLEWFEVKM